MRFTAWCSLKQETKILLSFSRFMIFTLAVDYHKILHLTLFAITPTCSNTCIRVPKIILSSSNSIKRSSFLGSSSSLQPCINAQHGLSVLICVRQITMKRLHREDFRAQILTFMLYLLSAERLVPFSNQRNQKKIEIKNMLFFCQVFFAKKTVFFLKKKLNVFKKLVFFDKGFRKTSLFKKNKNFF